MEQPNIAPMDAVVRAWFPNATDVFLLGDFNNWSTTATPLKHHGEGRWEVTVSIKAQVSRLSAFVWERGERFGRIVDLKNEGLVDGAGVQQAREVSSVQVP